MKEAAKHTAIFDPLELTTEISKLYLFIFLPN